MQMYLNDDVVRSMATARVFKEHDSPINSIDFHRTDDLLATAGNDGAINIYNTHTGTHAKKIVARRYGARHVVWTHHHHAVLHASAPSQSAVPPGASAAQYHALRYLGLYDNQYLRYFKGHTAPVTSLAMAPKNDLFMSAAQDRQVRLWDLRTEGCLGLLQAPSWPVAAFDQQGLIFAVAVDPGIIKLYDLKKYSSGPFDTFSIPAEAASGAGGAPGGSAPFSHLKFSNDGKFMLAVAGSRIHYLDAFNGKLLHTFSTGLPDGCEAPEATFSSDGQYILSGCEDRAIHAWSCATGAEVTRWREPHPGLPLCLKWAPRRLLVASACSATALWIPNLPNLPAADPTVGAHHLSDGR